MEQNDSWLVASSLLSFVDLSYVRTEHFARHRSTARINHCQQTLVAHLFVVRVNLGQLQSAVNILHLRYTLSVVTTVVCLQFKQQLEGQLQTANLCQRYVNFSFVFARWQHHIRRTFPLSGNAEESEHHILILLT